MDFGVTNNVWTVCDVFNTFSTSLDILNVSFDQSYSLKTFYGCK